MNTTYKTKKEKDIIIENLLFSLANNDISALEELYKLIKHDVYAFALSRVCNKFDADDIMQDTFLQIYKNAKLYESFNKPMAWIITIETNIINRYFQQKNKTISLNEVNINEQEESKNVNDNIVKNDFLNKLLSTLTEEERTIISLHIVSELKFREIAKQMNKPLSTVLSKYNRSIKKLQQITKEEEHE